MKYIIIGNGAAGIAAAEKLRELSSTDTIMIISSEDLPVYSKPMLPDYVGGGLSKEKLFLRNSEHYPSKNINFVGGCKVDRLDINNKLVILENNQTYSYDKLLIAVGAVPFIPPIEGLQNVGYILINSLTDADAIKDKAFQGGKAIIIGAGLTGIEMGFALKKLGMEVVILEREARILPKQLDNHSAAIFAEALGREGIPVRLETTVQDVINAEGTKAVTLSNGEILNFDFLLLSIGTRSNIEFVRDSEIKCGRGILIDQFMKTSVEDIYAAGDVAELVNNASNEYVPSYIWPNAMAQGQCAAYNMAGQTREFSNTASMYSSVQLRDIPFISMGMVNPQGEGYEVLVKHDTDGNVYKRLVLKDNIIRGMILIGDTASGNALSGLIRKNADVSGMRDILMDKDFAQKYKQIIKN